MADLTPEEREAARNTLLADLDREFKGGPPTISLGAFPAALDLPDFFVQMATTFEDGDPEYVRVAKLGVLFLMSWPKSVKWPGKGRPRSWFLGEDLLACGRGVYNSLRGAGFTHGQVLDAFNTAYRYRLYQGFSDGELQKARDFSKAQESAGS